MNRFTYQELAEMHLAYGAADESGRRARQVYADRYRNRRIPQHEMFARVHRNLCERGSLRSNMQDTGRRRLTRTVNVVEQVLQCIEDNPNTSTRAISQQLGVSQSSVWRILHEERVHPYHLQRVQLLQPNDYPKRVEFAQWFMQKCAVNPIFPASVLFTDEASFSREGVFNTHNLHVWAHDNPHGTRSHTAQHRFAVNVWAGIIGDYLLGPYLLPSRLDGRKYLIFLETVLPTFLAAVPAHVLRDMWYQHDGAPSHSAIAVRDYLNRTYGARWIGRGGPISWPPRSPDLSDMDFFFWGSMYETPIDSEMDLVARIAAAAGTVREMPGVFENVRRSMQRRCELCVRVNGRNFEHLL